MAAAATDCKPLSVMDWVEGSASADGQDKSRNWPNELWPSRPEPQQQLMRQYDELLCPPLIGGALSDAFVWRLFDVCLSVVYIGPNSRTERPRKTKIGTEVAHITTFKVKRSKVKVTRTLWLVVLAGQHGHTVWWPICVHDVYRVTTCRPGRGHIVAAARLFIYLFIYLFIMNDRTIRTLCKKKVQIK